MSNLNLNSQNEKQQTSILQQNQKTENLSESINLGDQQQESNIQRAQYEAQQHNVQPQYYHPYYSAQPIIHQSATRLGQPILITTQGQTQQLISPQREIPYQQSQFQNKILQPKPSIQQVAGYISIPQRVVEKQIVVNASHEECDNKYRSLIQVLNKEQEEKNQIIQSYQAWRYKCELGEVQNNTLNARISEQDEYIKQLLQQNEILRQDADQQRIAYTQLNIRLGELEQIKSKQEQQLKIFEQQNYQLHATLSVTSTEYETVKKNYRLLEEQFNQALTWESKFKETSQILVVKNQELDCFKQQYLQQLYDLSQQLEIIQQLESRITLLSQQNEGLYEQLSKKEKEYEELRIKYSKTEIDLNEKQAQLLILGEVKNQLQLVVRENEKIQAALKQKLIECEELREAIVKFQIITQEKDSEIERQKEIMTAYQEDHTRKDIEYQTLIARIKDFDKLQAELQNNEVQKMELEQRLSLLVMEFERQIQSFTGICQQIITKQNLIEKDKYQFNQIQTLKEELRKIIQEGSISSSQLNDWKNKYEGLKIINDNLKNQVSFQQELQKKMELLVQENQRLNAKLQELDDQKSQNQRISIALIESSNELKKLKDKLSENELKMNVLTNDNSSLIQQLTYFKKELDNYINKAQQADEIIRQNNQLKADNYQMEEKMNMLCTSFQEIDKQLKAKDEELQSSTIRYSQASSRIPQLEKEILQSSQDKKQLILTVEQLKNQLQKYDESFKDMENLVIQLKQEADKAKEYEGNLLLLSQEIDRQMSTTNQWQERCQSLELEKINLERFINQNEFVKKERDNLLIEQQQYRTSLKNFESKLLEGNQVSLRNKELESRNHVLNQELQQIGILLSNKVQEITQLKVDNSSLVEFRLKVETMKVEMERLVVVINDLYQQRQDFLGRFVICFAEIDSLRKKVQDYEIEISSLRKISQLYQQSEQQSSIVRQSLQQIQQQGIIPQFDIKSSLFQKEETFPKSQTTPSLLQQQKQFQK